MLFCNKDLLAIILDLVHLMIELMKHYIDNLLYNLYAGNANRWWWGYFLKYPPQQKILKIPPSKFLEKFSKNREKLRNLG